MMLVSSARRSRAPVAHLMPAPRAWWSSTPAERTPGRTRTALRRAGHRVLGADDARIALRLLPSANVLVADPRRRPIAAHGLRRPLMHAVLVPRGPRQRPYSPGAPRSALSWPAATCPRCSTYWPVGAAGARLTVWRRAGPRRFGQASSADGRKREPAACISREAPGAATTPRELNRTRARHASAMRQQQRRARKASVLS